jgi:hypothetical protein
MHRHNAPSPAEKIRDTLNYRNKYILTLTTRNLSTTHCFTQHNKSVIWVAHLKFERPFQSSKGEEEPSLPSVKSIMWLYVHTAHWVDRTPSHFHALSNRSKHATYTSLNMLTAIAMLNSTHLQAIQTSSSVFSNLK